MTKLDTILEYLDEHDCEYNVLRDSDLDTVTGIAILSPDKRLSRVIGVSYIEAKRFVLGLDP